MELEPIMPTHAKILASDQIGKPFQELLSALGDESLFAVEIMKRMGLSHRPAFRKKQLDPALEAHLMELTIPDKPKSNKQKWRKVGQ